MPLRPRISTQNFGSASAHKEISFFLFIHFDQGEVILKLSHSIPTAGVAFWRSLSLNNNLYLHDKDYPFLECVVYLGVVQDKMARGRTVWSGTILHPGPFCRTVLLGLFCLDSSLFMWAGKLALSFSVKPGRLWNEVAEETFQMHTATILDSSWRFTWRSCQSCQISFSRVMFMLTHLMIWGPFTTNSITARNVIQGAVKVKMSLVLRYVIPR